MLFNSYGFVFLFFPLVLAGYHICQKAGQRLWGGSRQTGLVKGLLLAASLIFYGCAHPEYVPVLIGSIALNYGLSWQILQAGHESGGLNKKKLALAAGIVLDLGALVCFKYINPGGFVPLGISFFTFTQIAFLMECYRGSLKRVDLLSYSLYVSFFPKMIQGPIALPYEMLPQFEDPGRRAVDWERIYRCLYLFVLGLFKKILIADTLGGAVDFGYADLQALNSWDGLIVMLSYTLQLYFDFSGYCDMAMGVAGFFGIELPLNFDSPYKASDILGFWKRWHITLTRFFTKYLYIPLGGNRKGKARTYLNCLIVFFLSGIWHGSGWQFVIWGLMHGILYVATKAWKDSHAGEGQKGNSTAGAMRKSSRQGRYSVGKVFCVFLTFLYVNIAWVFFRAPSVSDALSLIKRICSCQFGRVNWDLAGCFNLDEFWYVIKVLGVDGWQYAHYILMVVLLAFALGLVFFGESAVDYTKRAKPNAVNVAVMVVLFVWSILSFSGVSSFLYVNF